MSFETISLLLNWMEMGALLAILFRLSSTFNLIANTQRELRRAIYHLGERRGAELGTDNAFDRPGIASVSRSGWRLPILRALWVPTIWPACEIGGGRFPREQRLLEIVPITSPLTHKGSIISASRAKPRRTKTQAYRLPSLGVAVPVNHRAAICRSSLSNQSSNPSIILVSNWLAAVSLQAMASAVLPSDTPPQRLQPQHRCDLLRPLHRLSPRYLPPRSLYRFFHPQTLSSARGSSSQCRQVSSFICHPTAHDHRCQSDRRRRSRGGNRRCASLHQSAAGGHRCVS